MTQVMLFHTDFGHHAPGERGRAAMEAAAGPPLSKGAGHAYSP